MSAARSSESARSSRQLFDRCPHMRDANGRAPALKEGRRCDHARECCSVAAPPDAQTIVQGYSGHSGDRRPGPSMRHGKKTTDRRHKEPKGRWTEQRLRRDIWVHVRRKMLERARSRRAWRSRGCIRTGMPSGHSNAVRSKSVCIACGARTRDARGAASCDACAG